MNFFILAALVGSALYVLCGIKVQKSNLKDTVMWSLGVATITCILLDTLYKFYVEFIKPHEPFVYVRPVRPDDRADAVYIGDLQRHGLLHHLWARSKNARVFDGIPEAGYILYDLDKFTEAIYAQKYIRYLCGRPIKTNIFEDFADPGPYDRDNGDGAFLHAIKEFRELQDSFEDE